MIPLRHALGLAMAALGMLWAEVAAACPVCAQRNELGGPLRSVALGVLIVAPWFVALAVGIYIKKSLASAEAGRALGDTDWETME